MEAYDQKAVMLRQRHLCRALQRCRSAESMTLHMSFFETGERAWPCD